MVVFLAAAGLLAPLLHRGRISPVLTFLLVGLIVGPHGLGLIVGYGRVGRLLGELLSAEGVPMVALDRDADEVARRRERGETVYFGDARSPEMLSRLAAERASALVVTMDEASAVEAVVRAARSAWPHLPVYARARDSAHAAQLSALGAERVAPEALEASLDLAQAVLAGVGVGEEAARAVVEARRRSELDVIRAQGRGRRAVRND